MLVKNKGMTVKTGLDGVDKILLGGLRPGTVTEVSLLGLLHDLYSFTHAINDRLVCLTVATMLLPCTLHCCV